MPPIFYLANYNKTDMSDDRFKNKYCIPSTRAAWHDYNGGTYFITICTHAREHYFGEIRYDEKGEAIMTMSEIGKHAEECWRAIPQHFPHIQAPLWIIMPNHVHGIVIIDPLVETQNFASLQTRPNDKQNKFGSQSKNLASVIRGFKIGVTKYARENAIPFAWQPRFHDRIVRDTNELNKIATYIENNVAQWAFDELNGMKNAV